MVSRRLFHSSTTLTLKDCLRAVLGSTSREARIMGIGILDYPQIQNRVIIECFPYLQMKEYVYHPRRYLCSISSNSLATQHFRRTHIHSCSRVLMLSPPWSSLTPSMDVGRPFLCLQHVFLLFLFQFFYNTMTRVNNWPIILTHFYSCSCMQSINHLQFRVRSPDE